LGTQTVVVACKYERGIIVRTGKMKPMRVPNPAGGFVSEDRWVADGGQHLIRGPKRGMVSDDPESSNSDGFALTFHVPKDAMDRWMEDNKESAIVKSGLIKVNQSRNEVKAMTREMAGVRTGMEPLNPAGDPRTPRRVDVERDDNERPRVANRDREPIVATAGATR
jgi:hypothetical protein